MRNLAEHRRETAIKELGSTNVKRDVCIFGLIVFGVVLLSVASYQIVSDISRGPFPQVVRTVGLIYDLKRESFQEFEDTLENESVLTNWLLPNVQTVLTSVLRSGNEQAYVGRDGWLFYRADIDSLIANISPNSNLPHKTTSSGEAVEAIVDLKRQLAERNIKLIVVPTPVKPSIHSDKFSKRFQNLSSPIYNPAYSEIVANLSSHDILVYDSTSYLFDASQQNAQYLKTDTHWKPETMESVAKQLGAFISENVEFVNNPNAIYTKTATEVINIGDITKMLNLRKNQALFPMEHVTTHEIQTQSGETWKPDRNAEILFLGDSFSNIYSLAEMGWGKSAGFVEHLSVELSRPIDKIVVNDGGSLTTRQTLVKEPERLMGKRVVIYQFAARELFSGDWKLLQIPEIHSKPEDKQVETTQVNNEIIVNATIKDKTYPPSPGSVPYSECLIALHVEPSDTSELPNELIVFMWGMRKNRWTEATHLKIGQRVELRLRSWASVQAEYESYNRIELENEETWLLDVYWGELP